MERMCTSQVSEIVIMMISSSKEAKTRPDIDNYRAQISFNLICTRNAFEGLTRRWLKKFDGLERVK